MKIKDLKISLKLGLAFGIILIMLIAMGIVSINRSAKYVKYAEMSHFMTQKEVDHFKWVGKVKDSFIERQVDEREEGKEKCAEIDREIMFENAPNKNKDFIIAEKKKW